MFHNHGYGYACRSSPALGLLRIPQYTRVIHGCFRRLSHVL